MDTGMVVVERHGWKWWKREGKWTEANGYCILENEGHGCGPGMEPWQWTTGTWMVQGRVGQAHHLNWWWPGCETIKMDGLE
jgi:hypothetical protein